MSEHDTEPPLDDDDDDFSDLPEGGRSLLDKEFWTPARLNVVEAAAQRLEEREREVNGEEPPEL